MKQGDETMIRMGMDRHNNEGIYLYNEYLNWELNDKKESALQSSK